MDFASSRYTAMLSGQAVYDLDCFIGPKFYHSLALKLTHIGRLSNCCLDLIDDNAY